jgi:hypothetical protein
MENLPFDMLSGSSFDGWGLLGGFIFSCIGLWMFRNGRRRVHSPTTYCGLALMMYPYFVSGWKANWGIGLMLCGIAYNFWDRDL